MIRFAPALGMGYTIGMAKIQSYSLHEERPERSFGVPIAAGLQVLQGIALAAQSIYQYSRSDLAEGWPDWGPNWGAELSQDFWKWFQDSILPTGVGWVPFGILLILAALTLFRRWDSAWLVSMALQGLGLLIALLNYAWQSPNYFMMVSGIWMVFYLNLGDVQEVFNGKRRKS